jgi:hypothetical protein
MRVIVIEGTPGELQSLPQFRQLFEARASVVTVEPNGAAAAPLEPRPGRGEEGALVTVDLVRRALLRRPLHPNQRAVIGALYNAADWVSGPDIAAQNAIPETSIPGIMGGLGLRFSGTRGWPRRNIHGRPSRLVIEKERRNGVNYYRATDVFRRGIEAANVPTE